MVTIGMNYNALPGKNEIFENAFRGVLKAMQDIDGHDTSHLYSDVDDPQNYLIVSDWNSKDDFDDFIKSDAFAKVTNWGKEQILAGRPDHKVYTHD